MRTLLALALGISMVCAGCGESSDPTRSIDFIDVTAIAIESQYPRIANGTTNQFKAIGDFDGVFTRDVSGTALWSSANPAVLEISNEPGTIGLATAVSPGTTTVTASLGEVSRDLEFTVTNEVIRLITIEPPPPLPVGLTVPLTAEGTFSDESRQTLTHLAVWSSDNPDVAAAAPNGLVTAANPGTTVIRAAFGGAEGSANVEVTTASLQSITLDPAADTVLVPNETLQMKATGQYSDTTEVELTTGIVWTSSNDQIATISEAGLVTAKTAGQTRLTAAFEGRSASITVTVANLESIRVEPAEGAAPTVPVNGTLRLTAIGNFGGNVTRDITALVTWDFIATSAGRVTIEQGLVTGDIPGSVTIRARRNGISGTLPIIVTLQAGI